MFLAGRHAKAAVNVMKRMSASASLKPRISNLGLWDVRLITLSIALSGVLITSGSNAVDIVVI